jgi:hypothetical protein
VESLDDERRPVSDAGALGADAAAVLLPDVAAGVEAQPHSRWGERLRVLGAAERLEDPLPASGGIPTP